jgi:transposase
MMMRLLPSLPSRTTICVPNVGKRTVIVVDQASIHTCDALQGKLEEWNERQIEIFQLPSYSPELNLIEILWRFIKYE